MNLLELHILQSFSVNCINRDQFGSPKSAFFGGVQRARVSSQCWKRAVRLMASEESDMFKGSRTKYFLKSMTETLTGKGLDSAAAEKEAKAIAEKLMKFDKDGAAKNLIYFSKGELDNAAAAYMDTGDAKKKVEMAAKALKSIERDGVDIAFFGRMVADAADITLEGAALFSHAISTHQVSNDIDFFTAVDDLKPEDSTGAGHMGDIEFNSACYYRYMGINLDLLADNDHLAILSPEERRSAVGIFLKSVIMAVPGARKNSMFAGSLPGAILGIARKGQPLSLANAFEKPVRGKDGLLEKSKDVMKSHWGELRNTFSIQTEKEIWMPEKNLNDFSKELLDYVN